MERERVWVSSGVSNSRLIPKTCPTPCNPMDCSPPDSSLHGFLQARILEWIAVSSSREYSRPRDCELSPSALAGWFFSTEPPAGAAKSLQLCPTLCNPRDGSSPGSPVTGILQARTLEWVAISFSRGSSRPRDRTQVSHIVGRHFTVWATREAQLFLWGP